MAATDISSITVTKKRLAVIRRLSPLDGAGRARWRIDMPSVTHPAETCGLTLRATAEEVRDILTSALLVPAEVV